MASATKMSSLKGVAVPLTRTRLTPAASTPLRKRVVCEVQPVDSATAALIAATPVLVAASPASAKVTNGLVSEGTGLILGITEPALGWSILIVFGLIWGLYASTAKNLGGGENEDSGMSLANMKLSLQGTPTKLQRPFTQSGAVSFKSASRAASRGSRLCVRAQKDVDGNGISEKMAQYSDGEWDKLSMDELGTWADDGPPTPLLDTVNYPIHMKNFTRSQLRQLCKELRADIVHTVSQTGGHLGANLGVVELTVAMHYVFNCPEDKFIWDVGHQCYPHKILTGRRTRMNSIRQTDGLSGFTLRTESPFDAFGAGHSSTSVSAGLGMAVGRDARGRKNNVVSVIGDGAITGGMAYEAMNHAGFLDKNMIVVLNDNQQVSLPTQYNGKDQPPVGALSSALARIQANRPLRELREIAKGVTKQLPGSIQEATAKIDEYARGMISGSGSTLFEELGLYYIGPVDGHNVDDLISVLEEIKSTDTVGPVLLHIVTEKGRGYLPAESAADKMHGVVKYDVQTGKQFKSQGKTMSYTNYFADSLIAEAARDSRVMAVHAAMAGGTGLYRFENKFPERVFDVGIAEQHAVTFSAGLACEGLVPFCSIYSTFLQRGYDQVVHDVCLQKLPVRFMMDRAGLVGADGATHCGAFDVAYMSCLPNMVVMASSNEAELMHMVATAAQIDYSASCLRYPRGNGIGVDLAAEGIGPDLKGIPLPVGKGLVRRSGKDVCLVGYGSAVNECLVAADKLADAGFSATVVDARFCKPLDAVLIKQLALEHPIMVTVEEGSIGGFGSVVLSFLALEGLLDGNLKVRPMTLPDQFIEQGAYSDQLVRAGLTASHVAGTALKLLGKPKEAMIMVQES